MGACCARLNSTTLTTLYARNDLIISESSYLISLYKATILGNTYRFFGIRYCKEKCTYIRLVCNEAITIFQVLCLISYVCAATSPRWRMSSLAGMYYFEFVVLWHMWSVFIILILILLNVHYGFRCIHWQLVVRDFYSFDLFEIQ